ncbi:MAG: hypothetical protein ACHREM_25885, partial [Polyangiales bacterium]
MHSRIRSCSSAVLLLLACARCGEGSVGGASTGDAGIGETGSTGAQGKASDGGPYDAAHVDGGDDGGGHDGSGKGDAGAIVPDVGTPVASGDAGAVDLAIDVDATKASHAISPLIYGVNDEGKAASAHASIVRSGGNRMT